MFYLDRYVFNLNKLTYWKRHDLIFYLGTQSNYNKSFLVLPRNQIASQENTICQPTESASRVAHDLKMNSIKIPLPMTFFMCGKTLNIAIATQFIMDPNSLGETTKCKRC